MNGKKILEKEYSLFYEKIREFAEKLKKFALFISERVFKNQKILVWMFFAKCQVYHLYGL